MHGYCGGVLSIKLPLARMRPLGKLSIFIAVVAMVLQPFSVLGAPRAGASSTSILSDSFESSTAFDGWSAGSNWAVVSANAQDGTKRADYSGSGDNSGAELTQNMDTTGYENVELSFYYKRDGLDTGEFGKVLYEVNGTEYELSTYEGAAGDTDDDTEWQQAELSLPEAANQTEVTIIFSGSANSVNDKFKIDNVVLTADEIIVPADETAPASELVDPETSVINPSDIEVRANDETDLAEIHTVISNSTGVVDECSKLEITTNEETLGCTAVNSLADGDYSAVFYAVDAAGNMSEPGGFDFTVDHSMPSLSIVIPEDGLVTNVASLQVSGTASDALTDIDRVEYAVERVQGIAGPVLETLHTGTAIGTNSWQFSVVGLSSGTYRVNVTVYDLAGNERSQAHDVAVDSSAPVVTISSPLVDDEIQANDFSVYASATDAETGVQAVKADLFSGTQLLSYVGTCDEQTLGLPISVADMHCDVDVSTLPAGNYVLRFTATDAAGNASEPVFWNFRILSGTIVVVPTIPAGKGNAGSASGGVVTRQATNTIVQPRATLAVSSAKPPAPNPVSPARQSSIRQQATGAAGEVLAETDEKQPGCTEIMSVCWYWVPVGAAVAGAVTAAVVLYRRSG